MAPISGLNIHPTQLMPSDDVSVAGGTIDSTALVLDSALDNESFWWIKSDNPDDIARLVTIKGRTFSGEYRQETLQLAGTLFVITREEYVRILEITVSGVISSGLITIGRAFRSEIVTTPIYSVDISTTRQTTAFKRSFPVEYDTRVRYEKLAFSNQTSFIVANLTFTIVAGDGIDSTINVGAEVEKASVTDIENRACAPTGVTFVDIGDPTPGPTSMNVSEYASLWLRQTLGEDQDISRDSAILTITADALVNGIPSQGTYDILVEPAINVFRFDLPFSAAS